MPKADAQIVAAVDAAQRQALIDLARDRPKMTLGELVKLDKGLGDLARSIRIGELVGGVGQGASRQEKGRSKVSRGSSSRAAEQHAAEVACEVNTRTASGREAYEQAILEALREADRAILAVEIREQVGGTPLQARSTLNRLIAAGEIDYTGKARATRYHIP